MAGIFKRAIVTLAATAAVSAAAVTANAFADWLQVGFMGDINGDRAVTIADAVLLTRHLLGQTALTAENGYDLDGKIIGINGEDGERFSGVLTTADINRDGKVNIFDMVLLRKAIISDSSHVVWEWIDSAASTVTTSAGTTTAAETLTTTTAPRFIEPPIYDLYGSMPSQGEADMVVFYVDFPDCRYSYSPAAEEISNMIFGKADMTNPNYPFESMSAFLNRASKGSMKLGGDVYTYTAQNVKSAYEGDVWHISLVEEILAEFDSKIDFSKYDGDKDKVIDSILISVPAAAGDEHWWSAAGIFGGDSSLRFDGMSIGHVIVGNSQINSPTDYSGFNSSYLHEMGHCMGLPDYYLYNAEDFQGMHGSAGFEMMDDAICDFGALSKLQLGWYTREQVNIFDKNSGSRTYTLKSGQTAEGNCIIIPVGDLGRNYRSEYFVIEYSDLTYNNSSLSGEWWRATGSGVRIYHAEATENGDYWFNTFKYASGNDDATNYNNGRRFIRLVGEGTDSTDNLYRAGAVIDGTNPDFRAYDSSGQCTVDLGVTVTIDSIANGVCTVTVTTK